MKFILILISLIFQLYAESFFISSSSSESSSPHAITVDSQNIYSINQGVDGMELSISNKNSIEFSSKKIDLTLNENRINLESSSKFKLLNSNDNLFLVISSDKLYLATSLDSGDSWSLKIIDDRYNDLIDVFIESNFLYIASVVYDSNSLVLYQSSDFGNSFNSSTVDSISSDSNTQAKIIKKDNSIYIVNSSTSYLDEINSTSIDLYSTDGSGKFLKKSIFTTNDKSFYEIDAQLFENRDILISYSYYNIEHNLNSIELIKYNLIDSIISEPTLLSNEVGYYSKLDLVESTLFLSYLESNLSTIKLKKFDIDNSLLELDDILVGSRDDIGSFYTTYSNGSSYYMVYKNSNIENTLYVDSLDSLGIVDTIKNSIVSQIDLSSRNLNLKASIESDIYTQVNSQDIPTNTIYSLDLSLNKYEVITLNFDSFNSDIILANREFSLTNSETFNQFNSAYSFDSSLDFVIDDSFKLEFNNLKFVDSFDYLELNSFISPKIPNLVFNNNDIGYLVFYKSFNQDLFAKIYFNSSALLKVENYIKSTYSINRLPIDLSLIIDNFNTTKEYPTKIELVGINGNSENFDIPSIDNSLSSNSIHTVPLYNPSQEFMIRVTTILNRTYWYNFDDKKLYRNHNDSSEFTSVIERNNQEFDISFLETNLVDNSSTVIENQAPKIKNSEDSISMVNLEKGYIFELFAEDLDSNELSLGSFADLEYIKIYEIKNEVESLHNAKFTVGIDLIKDVDSNRSIDIDFTVVDDSLNSSEIYSLTINIDASKSKIDLSRGFNYISIPSNKLICSEQMQTQANLTDLCNQDFNIESFAQNSYVEYLFKYNRNEWSIWSNKDTSRLGIDRFSALSSLDGFVVKLANSVEIELPSSSFDLESFANLNYSGWHLVSIKANMSVDEVYSLILSQDKILDYLWIYRDGVWSIFAPLNDTVVDSTIPRVFNINRFESFWILVRDK